MFVKCLVYKYRGGDVLKLGDLGAGAGGVDSGLHHYGDNDADVQDGGGCLGVGLLREEDDALHSLHGGGAVRDRLDDRFVPRTTNKCFYISRLIHG